MTDQEVFQVLSQLQDDMRRLRDLMELEIALIAAVSVAPVLLMWILRGRTRR